MAFFNFKWSTPTRCSGTRVLPLIPNEIYLEIFEYIAPSNETTTLEHKCVLSSLALVCRFFCAISLSRIFKSLEFSARSLSDLDRPRYLSFCRALIKKKEPACSLALYARECTFNGWNIESDAVPDHLKWVYNGVLNLYIQAIAGMQNLESLTLSHTLISKPLLRSMVKLTKLKILVVDHCLFEEDAMTLDICGLSTFKLDTLQLSCYEPRWLVELATAALRVFRTTNWNAARHFMTQTTQSFIEELEILDVEDFVIVRNFLDRTPSIKALNISNVYSGHPNHFRLSPSSLPQLRSITCPPSLILDFIHSRPLERITLSGTHYHRHDHMSWTISQHEMTPNDVALLPKSCPTVRMIDIPASFYINVPIGQHFPHLDRLRLDFAHPESVRASRSRSEFSNAITALCDAWTETPPIRELTFHFHEQGLVKFVWDLQLQHQIIIDTIMRTFPTITRISFHDYVQWEIENHSGNWRAFVPHRHQVDVRSHLDSLRPGLKDYNGCYAAVLSQP